LRPTAFVPGVAGTIASQRFNNLRATTRSREPLICGVLGGASKWFGLRARASGTMVIDTSGSSIDTLLSAYRRTNVLALAANRLDCNDNAAPDVLHSLVSFAVTNGQEILVTIDGVNGQRGRVVLNWKLMNEISTLKADPLPLHISPVSITSRSATGTKRLLLAPADRRSVVLESSTNLIWWTPIHTNAPHSPPAVFDLPTGGAAQRFFRVR
jgi:hypothetical protein